LNTRSFELLKVTFVKGGLRLLIPAVMESELFRHYRRQAEDCADTVFMMSGQAMKYLCAILNSNSITRLMKNTALTSGMGVTRWKKFAVERLPIANIATTEQRPFIELVDSILKAKAANPKADTTEQEAQIDRLVYHLYGLTMEEVRIVQQHAR